MTKLAKAYIHQQQQLLVDDTFNMPSLTVQSDDVIVQKAPCIVAREWPSHQSVPQSFQFVALRQLIPNWSNTQAEEASRAIQLLEWKKNHQFCGRCGEKTTPHASEYCMCCPSCTLRQYPRINPCVITIITKGDQVLLAKSIHRKDNMYGLIAGFVEVGETLEQAVARETLEEVGIKVKNIRYLESQPWPFPSNLMLGFHAEYDSGDIIVQEDEIADAQFFDRNAMPDIPFAGSIAHKIITAWINETLA
ncbi:NAD(+) diphosphatase [Acinetobacter rathckeae]|uniref:NAD(+) diphosphatase n=1 Tax=Acinetobacter rathckeae TaxID=2605272 RepID=UPI0018A2AE7A|nr:NAD(+) diphosphatase [Acinetobacter rathckeae]MBF7688638.1 NAD(+) diphosphatase [Acinetobacter rathckeae]MBF7695884.1 NAD(+) diphosphatase [Acinetobacter rathckeae]